ncbi:MAG: molybdate ABC transporter substrate-binding protein [Rikenellaceae bacterium]
MRRLMLTALAICFSLATSAQTKVNVAAAANTRDAVGEIAALFEKKNPNIKLVINFGSSGMFVQQISNGAGFDIFLSADKDFALKLESAGKTIGLVRDYAYGKLTLYSKNLPVETLGLKALDDKSIHRIAIANPQSAPYGKYAVDMLTDLKLFDKYKSKIIYGENIGTTAQYVFTGNAEIGFIALSQIKSPDANTQGHFYIIPSELYSPIIQSCVLIKTPSSKPEAKEFMDFLFSSESKEIWIKYGYTPGE